MILSFPKKWISVILSSLLLIACQQNGSVTDVGGDTNRPEEVSDTPASGKVMGSSWTFRSGSAKITSDKKMYSVTLYAFDIANPCDLFAGFQNQSISFYAPTNTGVYSPRSMNEMKYLVTFYDFANGQNLNHATDNASVETVSISSYLSGKIYSKHSDDSYVNGTFEVPICN